MQPAAPIPKKLGLIAGSGRFPLLSLREAVSRGIPVVVAAIKEEASPELEALASSSGQAAVTLHWIGLGQLGKLIDLFKRESVSQAILAGQVQHSRIFAPGSDRARRLLSALPDFRMLRMLVSLPRRDTESLIGGIVRELASEGVELLDSTFLLSELVPAPGVLTRRKPSGDERKDIDYGRPVAKELARLDVGQTIVVKSQAVVAVESMEGTDETIRRAARLVDGQRLSVIKVSRPSQDMRFDVPVVGLETLRVLRECNVSALSIDARRTLMLDRSQLIEEADRGGVTIVAGEP